MPKLLILVLCLTVFIMMLSPANSAPSEALSADLESDDLSTADSIGYGYYARPVSTYYPYYGGSYYKYGYGYGGYRGYGRYYRRPIYPIWG